MKYYETVVEVIIVGNYSYKLCPHTWRHVTGINRASKLVGVYLGVEIGKLIHVLDEMVEVQWFKRSCFRIPAHADGAACVNKQYAPRLVRVCAVV